MTAQHKTVTVHVRMTPSEQARFQKMANGNLSAWMRHAALEMAHIDGPTAREILLSIQNELVAQGRNLNQIARRINQGGDSHDLRDAIAETAAVRKQVTKAVSRVM